MLHFLLESILEFGESNVPCKRNWRQNCEFTRVLWLLANKKHSNSCFVFKRKQRHQRKGKRKKQYGSVNVELVWVSSELFCSTSDLLSDWFGGKWIRNCKDFCIERSRLVHEKWSGRKCCRTKVNIARWSINCRRESYENENRRLKLESYAHYYRHIRLPNDSNLCGRNYNLATFQRLRRG